MVYYPRRIKEDCYFEVEIIKLNACIDFGYVYCDDFKKLASGEYGVGNLGITVNTYGKVVVQGENVD